MDDAEAGQRDFGSGSGSSGEGTVEQSSWGRVHREQSDSDSNVAPSATDKADPLVPAQELPQTDDPSVSTFGGNIAVLDDNVDVNFNDVDVYAPDCGGIDCVHECFDASGTNDSSLFNPDTPDGTDAYGQEFETGDGGTDQSALDTGIGISQGGIAVGNGVNENTDLSALQTEVDANFDYLKQLRSDPLSWTHEWDISGGEYANYNADDLGYDLVLSDLLGNDLQGVNGTGDVFTSLNIVYIDTNGSDLKFNNTNFILDGMQDQDFIFLLNEGANFLVTNSKLLTGPNMDLFSTLWFVGGNEKRTIDFSQSESNKMSFWNHSPEGTIQANNYRACGQWVASNIQDWNDFSVDRCAFGEETPKVPVPATLPLLLGGIGLFGFAVRRRRT